VLADKGVRSAGVPPETAKLLKYYCDGELALLAFDPDPEHVDSFCAVSKDDVVMMHNVPESLKELDMFLS